MVNNNMALISIGYVFKYNKNAAEPANLVSPYHLYIPRKQ